MTKKENTQEQKQNDTQYGSHSSNLSSDSSSLSNNFGLGSGSVVGLPSSVQVCSWESRDVSVDGLRSLCSVLQSRLVMLDRSDTSKGKYMSRDFVRGFELLRDTVLKMEGLRGSLKGSSDRVGDLEF